MRWISRIVFFQILKWDLKGSIDPEINKCVIIVAPHTSWYDFFIGILVRNILDIQINFIAKKELFKAPYGWYFRWVGGISLDRTSNQKKVEVIANIFNSKKVFRLALSPEGTRKKTERWKTGFYYIACKADVPVIPIAFDYSRKTVVISEPFYTGNFPEQDIAEILQIYSGVSGKVAENFNTPLR
mgnify:CR=1 FL=1